MDRADAVELLIEYYEHPRNRGTLVPADLQASGGTPGCGDLVTIAARVDAAGCLTAVAFEGDGCTISQAAASLVTELAIGKTLAEVERLSDDDLIDLLGREVVAVRPRCATLGLSVLKQAVFDYRHSSRPLSGD